MRGLVFGAGSIGRGFIGQLLGHSGFELIFVDVNEVLLSQIRAEGKYTVRLVTNERLTDETIRVSAAVNGRDLESVAATVATADLIFTAVGANALKYIAKGLAEGLLLRYKRGLGSVNVILCENMLDAHLEMKKLLEPFLGGDAEGVFAKTGFLRASVGRMVPMPDPDDPPLLVKAEPYFHLSVDGDAVVGAVPYFEGLELVKPFGYAIERKLFIHNLGHAACAWLGFLNGYPTIWMAVGDDALREEVKAVMTEAAHGLSARYDMASNHLYNHIDELLRRFANRPLNDMVSRVGRDIERKMSPNERVVGAINMCREYGLPCDAILKIAACGLKAVNIDPEGARIKALLAEEGARAAFAEISQVKDELILDKVAALYAEL